jgi:Amt family ammonium transporter
MNPFLLLIFFALGALLLRAGFALQASGSLRAKNSASAILRITADAAAAALAFWAVGAAILFQHHNGWFAIDHRFLFQEPPELASTEFFHLTLCLIGGAVIAGALAERAKFYVSVAASALLAGLVFPIVGHWIWFGKLHDWGFIDFGGATAIHLSAAVFGTIGVAVVGSRAGKYNKDGSSNSIPGHSLPMVGLGAMLLLVGWLPYLLGCVVSHWSIPSQIDDVLLGVSATNILLAGMSGVAGGLLYSHYRYRKPDMFFAYSGLLGALVAISPGLMVVSNVGAAIIGLVAGFIVPIATLALDLDARLDDPIGLIAIHGIGAIWGILATAILDTTDATFVDHLRRLAIQAGGLGAVLVISTAAATALFLGLKAITPLRVVEADEFDGLDIGEHDINSYPDFQQTTIKSYHLREA